MSNGDAWKLPDGRIGLEVGRNDKQLFLSVMRSDWPWPDYPIWVAKSQCRKQPSRYHGKEVIEEALL